MRDLGVNGVTSRNAHQCCCERGERGRNRTYNLLIKSQLLCQLSYAPTVGTLAGRTNENYSIRLRFFPVQDFRTQSERPVCPPGFRIENGQGEDACYRDPATADDDKVAGNVVLDFGALFLSIGSR
jgi:hypothetical protein